LECWLTAGRLLYRAGSKNSNSDKIDSTDSSKAGTKYWKEGTPVGTRTADWTEHIMDWTGVNNSLERARSWVGTTEFVAQGSIVPVLHSRGDRLGTGKSNSWVQALIHAGMYRQKADIPVWYSRYCTLGVGRNS